MKNESHRRRPVPKSGRINDDYNNSIGKLSGTRDNIRLQVMMAILQTHDQNSYLTKVAEVFLRGPHGATLRAKVYVELLYPEV